MRLAYLDHNATTPVRPEVFEAMRPCLEGGFGNPNSAYRLGQQARQAVEAARVQVARLLNARSPDEVVFTSCGSESDVLAIGGAAERARRDSGGKKTHVVISAIEHDAVRLLARELRSRGFEVTEVPVDGHGRVGPTDVESALRPSTAVVSIMLANNEVGTIQPIADIARLCRERDVCVHTDAVQAVGRIPVDVQALGVDLLSLSGHKINASKGVGALYVRKGTKMAPLVTGHQEKNRRGGTENVAGIAGLGMACELAGAELEGAAKRLKALRDRLEQGVLKIPGSRANGHPVERLPGTLHVSFEGVDGHSLVVALDLEGVCASSGPACSSGATEPSHVLRAMGVPASWGSGSLRLSLGWGSTDADVDQALAVIPKAVERLRAAKGHAVGKA